MIPTTTSYQYDSRARAMTRDKSHVQTHIRPDTVRCNRKLSPQVCSMRLSACPTIVPSGEVASRSNRCPPKQEAASCPWCHLLVVELDMSGQHQPLELGRIFVPQLGRLPIQRTCAVQPLRQHSSTSTLHFSLSFLCGFVRETTYLFGSPNRLCRLSKTLCTLYTALHLSLRMSRQIRPEKSTLGW